MIRNVEGCWLRVEGEEAVKAGRRNIEHPESNAQHPMGNGECGPAVVKSTMAGKVRNEEWRIGTSLGGARTTGIRWCCGWSSADTAGGRGRFDARARRTARGGACAPQNGLVAPFHPDECGYWSGWGCVMRIRLAGVRRRGSAVARTLWRDEGTPRPTRRENRRFAQLCAAYCSLLQLGGGKVFFLGRLEGCEWRAAGLLLLAWRWRRRREAPSSQAHKVQRTSKHQIPRTVVPLISASQRGALPISSAGQRIWRRQIWGGGGGAGSLGDWGREF